MNLLDYIIIIMMVFLIVKGLFRGFIREIASLIGIILGIWLGKLFEPSMTNLLRSYLPSSQYLPLLSFAVLFAATLISFNILGWAIKLLFKKIFLGWLDRSLGVGLAVIKGVVITYLAIVMLTFFLPMGTPLIAGSKLAPWIIRSYQSIISLISPNHYETWKQKIVGGKRKMGKIMSDKIEDITKKNE